MAATRARRPGLGPFGATGHLRFRKAGAGGGLPPMAAAPSLGPAGATVRSSGKAGAGAGLPPIGATDLLALAVLKQAAS